MLPQSRNAHEMLEGLIVDHPTSDFPVETAKELLELVPLNEKVDDNTKIKEEKAVTKWRCTVCGYIHEGEQPPEFCPVCKQPADKFEKIE